MPSLYYMNPPPNPFWDFVASMEDHPLINGGRPGRPDGPPGPPPHHHGHPHHHRHHPRGPSPPAPPPAGPEPDAMETEKTEPAAPSSNDKGKTKEKQSYVEDPPEVDPATVNPAARAAPEAEQQSSQQPQGDFPFWGRGPWGAAAAAGEGRERGGPGCRGRGERGRHHHGGPPPFMMGGGPFGGPWWARRGPRPEGAPGHGPEGFGPHHHRGGMRGPCGRPGGRHGPPPHGAPRSPPPPGFNLGEFLNNLGQRLGVDLSGAAEAIGGGVDRFAAGSQRNAETDFEPRADIFDTPAAYVVHLSLPGAKKEDVGVDWDGENSVLRIAGVVHRPGVDEELLRQLVVDGRKRETGVFERAVRLGTKRDPARIDVAAISAKMTDGVLVVKVPKVEVKHEKREVPISSSSNTTSPARSSESEKNKKEAVAPEKQRNLLFDADEEMHDDIPTYTAALPHRTPAPEMVNEKQGGHDTKEETKNNSNNNKKDTEKEQERDDRSETLDHDEHLPRYEGQVEDDDDEDFHDDAGDWEKYGGSDDEGEYVKITVN